jgi:hypothetical protein
MGRFHARFALTSKAAEYLLDNCGYPIIVGRFLHVHRKGEGTIRPFGLPHSTADYVLVDSRIMLSGWSYFPRSLSP